MPAQITVGCESYIVRQGKLLMGLRGPAAYLPDTWALPGGRVEYLERADQCLVRELKEELGVTVTTDDFKLIAVTDDPQPQHQQHHLHLTFAVTIGDQKPQLLEPDECQKWEWFDLDKLPEPLFPPHTKVLATIAGKSIY